MAIPTMHEIDKLLDIFGVKDRELITSFNLNIESGSIPTVTITRVLKIGEQLEDSTHTYYLQPIEKPKTYKSQREIYEELFQDKYNTIREDNTNTWGEYANAEREANIHATKNTTRIWREQWD